MPACPGAQSAGRWRLGGGPGGGGEAHRRDHGRGHDRGLLCRRSGPVSGEEIFVPYTHGSSYILTADDVNDRREQWCYVAKGRKITVGTPESRIRSTPAPPRASGGRGGKPPCRGPCFSTRRRRVCANLTSAAGRPANRLPAYMVRLVRLCSRHRLFTELALDTHLSLIHI